MFDRSHVGPVITRSALVGAASLLTLVILMFLCSGGAQAADGASLNPGPAVGIDADADGLFEYLWINETAVVNDAGTYSIEAVLYDGSGVAMSSVSMKTYLNPIYYGGVTFGFPGSDLASNNVPGTFNFTVTLLDGDGAQIAEETHMVPGFAGADFEAPAWFSSSPTDEALDTNGDGGFEYLAISVEVSSASNQYYHINAVLTDLGGNSITTSTADQYIIAEGTASFTVRFPGSAVMTLADGGPYSVSMTLVDYSSCVISTITYSTGTYDTGDFQAGAHLQPPFADQAYDANGNDIFDELVARTDMVVASPGKYYIDARLLDGTGNEVDQTSVERYYAAGTFTEELHFSVSMIVEQGLDGPYTVTLALKDEYTTLLGSSSFVTQHYYATDFEQRLKFQPFHEATVVDDDGDGLNEILRVEVSIYTDSNRYCFIEGVLMDSSGSVIASSSDGWNYYSGDHNYIFDFDGGKIASSGSTGPFSLWMRVGSNDLYDEQTVAVEGYDSTDFEAWAVLSPDMTEELRDDDGNGLFEALEVEVGVEVNHAHDYQVWAELWDCYGTEIATTSYVTHLDPGMTTVSASFPGSLIALNGVDGPYLVGISLLRTSGMLGDAAEGQYSTDEYSAASFQQDVRFTSAMIDYALDQDINGYLDTLVVECTLDTSVPGFYTVSGQWNGAGGQVYGWSTVEMYLESGLSSVELYFSGINIATDGPYLVQLTVKYYDWPQTMVDQYDHWTQAYLGGSFEEASIIGCVDTPLDQSGDGLYESLQLDFTLRTTISGYFVIDYELEDLYYNTIVWEHPTIYLEAGTTTVSVNVPGNEIYKRGSDGWFTIDIRFRTEEYRYLDWETFTTEVYFVATFDHTRMLEPIIADVQDTDGNGLYDSLLFRADIYSIDWDYYSMDLRLEDSDGQAVLERYDQYYLSPGTTTMEFWFDLLPIIEHGVDGPYTMIVSFSKQVVTVLTTSFILGELEPPATIRMPCVDMGIDENGNGLFEYLAIEVSVDVKCPGFYYLQCPLTVALGVVVPLGEMSISCPSPGLYTVTAYYPGNNLFQAGIDGTATVEVWMSTYSYTWGGQVHTTQAYTASQFERVEVMPSISDHGEDIDVNGKLDLLVVEIEMHATSETYLNVYPRLFDKDSNLVYDVPIWTSLVVGTNFVRLEFPGLDIGCALGNGPYTVILDCYTSLGAFSLEYITGDYSWDQFEHIMFTENIAEESPDGDGDGQYEYLFVGVEAYSTLETDLFLYVTVTKFYDNGGYWSMGYVNSVHIMVGTQTLGMKFPGSELMEEGPFHIDVEISRYEGWDVKDLVLSSFETAAYPADHFEPPIEILSATDRLDEGDLLVEAEVEVSAPGHYILVGYLYPSDGWNNIAYAEIELDLEIGTQTIQLRFPGGAIYASHCDGPYSFVLAVSGERPYLDIEWYETGPYLYNDFNPPIRFTGQSWDHGNDIDGNGVFEELVVEAEVEVLYPGTYYLTGDIMDGNGNYICHEDGEGVYFESAGLYTLSITIPARMILEAGLEGPYQVSLALVDWGWFFMAGAEHWTAPYSLDMFEWPAILRSPVYGHAVDVDSDGLYDWLEVELEFEVSKPGTYLAEAVLFDSWGYWLHTYYAAGWFEVGSHSVKVLIPGNAFLDYYLDGYQQVIAVLCYQKPDGYPFVLQRELVSCEGYYDWSMFEPVTQVQPPHSDHLEDRDLDGLYDWLAVDVVVNVVDAGKYTLKGELFANLFTDLITEDQVSRNLKPGLQTITLYFSGVEIWAMGLEGPYAVELRLFDCLGNQIYEGDHYITSYFGPADCERLSFEVGNKKGVVDLRSEYVEVIIFGSKMAKVHRIDPCSVRLGDGEEWARPCKWEFKDVNHDGRDDLVLKFKSKDLREILRPGEDVLVLQFEYNGSTVQLEKQVQVKFGRCDR